MPRGGGSALSNVLTVLLAACLLLLSAQSASAEHVAGSASLVCTFERRAISPEGASRITALRLEEPLRAPMLSAFRTPRPCRYDSSALTRRDVQRITAAAVSTHQLRSAARGASPSTELRGRSTTSAPMCVATNTPATSDVLLNSSKQLQSKFKHAGDFGVTGNYSKANAANFSAALNQHINSGSVTKIAGTYRGNPVMHYLDPSTGLNVIVDPSGAFVSGWKLNPAQLQNVLKHGGL